jgi:hypothetical protein
VLDRLSSGKQTSVKRGGAFVFFHNFCAFVSNAEESLRSLISSFMKRLAANAKIRQKL